MLGIDIGAYSIKAAVAKKSGKKVIIEQIAAEVLPIDKRGSATDAGTLQRIVADLIKKVGKGQKAVALCIPTSSAILKTLQVDTGLNDDLIEGEVQMELINFVPFPLDQVYADFVRLGKSENIPGKDDVFVVASRKDVVDRIANTVNSKSIATKIVDVQAFATAQALEQIRGAHEADACAIIDIGHQSTKLYVFQSGDMLFSREQQIGGFHLTEAIADAAGVDLAEAEAIKHHRHDEVPEVILDGYFESFSEQIALAMELFTSTNSNAVLQTVYVTGGGSLAPGLLENLSESIPAYRFEPLSTEGSVRVGKKTYGMTPEVIAASCCVVLGLAVRK